jgi:hypothetical protein
MDGSPGGHRTIEPTIQRGADAGSRIGPTARVDDRMRPEPDRGEGRGKRQRIEPRITRLQHGTAVTTAQQVNQTQTRQA